MDEPSKDILLPDGTTVSADTEPATDRAVDRSREDETYVPVILKRTDEVRRHPDDVLEHAIEEGLEQLQRPAFSLSLSAFSAGLIVGFSAMAVAVVSCVTDPLGSSLLTRIATAAVYPLGFIVCVMSGTQLYTEHTATAVYPVLDGRASWMTLIRSWSLIIVGNLTGALAAACLLWLAEPVVHAAPGYLQIGHHLVEHDTASLLVSAILAGWLMALGAWLVVSTGPDISQMAAIYIVTFLIGIGGLHHSIAGSAEMFTALLVCDEFQLTEGLRFITTALFGNMIGGSVFVGLLNYGHIRKTQPSDGADDTTRIESPADVGGKQLSR